MRKKAVNHLADTIFWYLIYFLPVIAYLLFLFAEPSSGTTVVNFATFFESIGFDFIENNIILSALNGLFGSNGILPLFANNVPLYISTWFICAMLTHLATDFLLFIPRLAHKFMDSFTKCE